jgi:hypothetical protein
MLHALALVGSLRDATPEAEPLVEAGLAIATPVGVMLTARGREAHEALLARERERLDLARLGQIYERFLAANGPFKALTAGWPAASADAWEAVAELREAVERVEPALRRTAEHIPRFAAYGERLRAALERVEAGDPEYVAGIAVDSVHTVWMQLHEDYLQTLGRSREDEGSY